VDWKRLREQRRDLPVGRPAGAEQLTGDQSTQRALGRNADSVFREGVRLEEPHVRVPALLLGTEGALARHAHVNDFGPGGRTSMAGQGFNRRNLHGRYK
jgi:hypothetical protein